MTGSGRPVIFIPDLGAPGEVWDTTIAHLAGRAEAHVLDIAGFAGNPATGSSLLPELPVEIATYIREKRLDRPRVVGHMFGATVAYAVAMNDPALLGGVLAIDARPSRTTGNAEELAEAQEGRRAWTDATPERFAQMTTRRIRSMMRDATRAQALAEKAAQSDQRVMAETFFAMMSRDTRSEISRIRAPVIVLLTTDNLPEGAVPEVEASYREQLGLIPRHALIVVNASRHYVMFDAPGVFFANLDRFLDLPAPAME